MRRSNINEENKSMEKCIVIVGGGPGGYVAAIRAAQLGAKVHLVESESLGGTCLNVGCIPTKVLLHSADLYFAAKKGKRIGLVADNILLDWPTLMTHKANVVNRFVQGVKGLLKANKVTIHQGRASFLDDRTLKIDGQKTTTLSADVIVLAVGSVSTKILFPGCELKGVIDSTAALNLPKIPSSIVIIGGGVIGTEFAALFNTLGTKVTVVEMLPEILPPVDRQIAVKIRQELTRNGVDFKTDSKLLEVQQIKDNLLVKVESNGKQESIRAEYVMTAVGRRPNIENLGLETVGIEIERGKILVDNNFATNVPSIYAIGDCNGQIMLAHVASAQGIAAVEYAMGCTPSYNKNVIPYCIYTNPEVSGVGVTEEQAKDRGIQYKTGMFSLAGNSKSVIEGCDTGMIKIITDTKHGEILGAHMIGPRVTDLIAEISLAMTLESTVDELISTIHAHPTVSEGVCEAALSVQGDSIHWPPGLKV